MANTYWIYFLCEALICVAISYPLSLPSSTTTSLPPSLPCHNKYCSYSQVHFSGSSYFEPKSFHSPHLSPGIRMVNQEAMATHTMNSGNTPTPPRFQPQKLRPCRTQLLKVHSLRAQCHQVSRKVTIWGRFIERWQREIASSTVVLFTASLRPDTSNRWSAFLDRDGKRLGRAKKRVQETGFSPTSIFSCVSGGF